MENSFFYVTVGFEGQGTNRKYFPNQGFEDSFLFSCVRPFLPFLCDAATSTFVPLLPWYAYIKKNKKNSLRKKEKKRKQIGRA